MRHLPPAEENPRIIASVINELIQGRSDATQAVTLDINVATTTVSRDNFSGDAAVVLFPSTANAATEFISGNLYVSDVSPGSFTITHTNNAVAGRTFYYMVFGG